MLSLKALEMVGNLCESSSLVVQQVAHQLEDRPVFEQRFVLLHRARRVREDRCDQVAQQTRACSQLRERRLPSRRAWYLSARRT